MHRYGARFPLKAKEKELWWPNTEHILQNMRENQICQSKEVAKLEDARRNSKGYWKIKKLVYCNRSWILRKV